MSAHNSAAWGRDTAFDAWCARFGPPEEAAARLLRDPGRCLGPLLPYLLQLGPRTPAAPRDVAAAATATATAPESSAHPGALPLTLPLRGLTAANLCGSHGHKAVALAALGAAHVTVVDVSAGNAAYATRLAAAAGLQVVAVKAAADGGSGGGGGSGGAVGAGAAGAGGDTLTGAGAGGGGGGGELRYLLADLAECAPQPQQPRTGAGGGGGSGSGSGDPGGGGGALLYDRQYDLVLMELGVLHYFLVGGWGEVMCPSRVGQGLLPPFMVSVHRHEDACQDMQGRGQGRGTGRARGGTGQGRR